MTTFKVNKIETPTINRGEQIVFCDLDGTLYDDRHRLPFLPHHPWDNLPRDSFKPYHDKMYNDKVVPNMLKLLCGLDCTDVIFFTSRPKLYRPLTNKFLVRDMELSLNHVPNLYMRGNKDISPSTELKSKIFDKYIKDEIIDRLYPIIIFDNELLILEAINNLILEKWPELNVEYVMVTIKGNDPSANFYSLEFS